MDLHTPKPLPRYRVACFVNHELLRAATFISFDDAVEQARNWYKREAHAAFIEVCDLEGGSREVVFGDYRS